LNKAEFARAAKISMGGQELSQNLLDILFALFDKAGKRHSGQPPFPSCWWTFLGDGALSRDEFIEVLRNRLRRGVRRSLAQKTAGGSFVACVRDELRRDARARTEAVF